MSGLIKRVGVRANVEVEVLVDAMFHFAIGVMVDVRVGVRVDLLLMLRLG